MDKRFAIPPILSQEYEQVSVERISPHDRNVNNGDTGRIYQSIQDNGFYGACIVQRSTRLILAGSHRWNAAKQSGLPVVPVIWVDVDDDAALRIMLSDNATARAGHDNPAALAELLAELAGTEKGLSGTSFDTDFLDDLLNDLNREAAPVEPPPPPPAQEDTRPGVIVFCENVVEQENVYQRLREMGWDPRKTDVTEKSVTSLAKTKK